MGIKVNVIFYSMYGHVYRMAEAVAEGAKGVAGTQVSLFQVPEVLSDAVLEQYGAKAARQAFAKVPVATLDNLTEANAIIFGTPTRFGNMAGQMRNFLDQTGSLWLKGALVGKVGSVFTSTGTGGGNESTILTFIPTLLHHGMIYVGLPYAIPETMDVSEVRGGSPYGAGTIAAPDGSRLPSAKELTMARFQGKHVAGMAAKLHAKSEKPAG